MEGDAEDLRKIEFEVFGKVQGKTMVIMPYIIPV